MDSGMEEQRQRRRRGYPDRPWRSGYPTSPWRQVTQPDPNADAQCPWQQMTAIVRKERKNRESWLEDQDGTAWSAECSGCKVSHGLKWQCTDCLLLFCKKCTGEKRLLGIGKNTCHDCLDQNFGSRPNRGEPWRKAENGIQPEDSPSAARGKKRQALYAKPWQCEWPITPWDMACAHCSKAPGVKWHCRYCHKGYCEQCTMVEHRLGGTKDRCWTCRDMERCGLTNLSPDTMRTLMSMSDGPPAQTIPPMPKRTRTTEVAPDTSGRSQSGVNLHAMQSLAADMEQCDTSLIARLEEGFTTMGVMNNSINNRPLPGAYGRSHLGWSHRPGGTPPSDHSLGGYGSDNSRSSSDSRDQVDSRSPSARRARPFKHWRLTRRQTGAEDTPITNGSDAAASSSQTMSAQVLLPLGKPE